MKKFVAMMLALAICFSIVLPSFAAISPEDPGLDIILGAIDSADQDVKQMLRVEINAESKSAEAELNDEKLQDLIGSEFNDKMILNHVYDVIYTGSVYPLTLTFKVNGVSAGDTVIVLHRGKSGWEKKDATVGNGSVTVTFDSLSPVAFVVEKDVPDEESPITGTESLPMGVIALLSLAVAVYAVKRCKAEA